MLQIKKILAILCASVLLIPLSGCQSKDPKEEQQAFDEFMEQQFVDAMQSDYSTMHTYLQDPSAFGIDEDAIEVSLGTRFDEESMQEAKESFEETYAQFQSFDRELLTQQQQDLYDTFAFEAEINEQLMDEKFDYYPQVFESMSGLQFQLPSLFSDWEVRDEQDVKDLILLLDDVLPYVNSALDYTLIQEEKGLLMLDTDSVKTYCEGILEKGVDSSILSSMKEKVEALGLSEEQTKAYQQQLEDSFAQSFLPAYQNIYDRMEEIEKNGKNNEEGLAAFPDGKEYFVLILQQNVGSDKTPEEIQEMMDDTFEEYLTDLQMILWENMEDIEPLLYDSLPQTSYNSYSEILDTVAKAMQEDFPEVSNLTYHIEDMNEEIASDGIAAYFNIPSIDGDSIKQMRVNPDNADPSSLSTYITVSHEGFPGHMYQYAYLYENMDSNYAKTMSSVNAYVEGYAVYASYQSLGYLDDINANLLEAYQINELASYCLYINADIGIHYEGWSQEEMKDYFTSVGIVLDDENAELAYDQLQANPAAFEPYYVGYQEFINLREKAEEALGEDFDAKDFHTAILECGIVPFDVVERHVDAYIDQAE